MDNKEIKETNIWTLFEKGKDYLRLRNHYSNYNMFNRFYNGNQWEGLIVKDIEPIQLNFIKPILRYKVGSINENLWAINYNAENYEDKEFLKTAQGVCDMFSLKARNNWEKDKFDYKLRDLSLDAAICGEGVAFFRYDKEKNLIVSEILDSPEIMYGNENDPDIQSQPYILVKKRLPVSIIKEMNKDLTKDELDLIVGDMEISDEATSDIYTEIDPMCTLVYKFYKVDGKVYYSSSTRYVDIEKDEEQNMTLYPFAHMIWEDKKGSARGQGDVEFLIPNQIEVNRMLMREAITIKQSAYQKMVVNTKYITNPESATKIGGIMYTNSNEIDDVRKAVGYISPANMSFDSDKFRSELISNSRELSGAGDIATGTVNPESASGKAILAVQQASAKPLNYQVAAEKKFIENVAEIYIDMLLAYNPNGIELENEITDEVTNEKYIQIESVPSTILDKLIYSVKIDATPKSSYDKYAQELTLENMLKAGYFSPQRLSELKTYVDLLDNDAVAPKIKLQEAIEKMTKEQQKIANIEAQAELMQQKYNQYINSSPEQQANQINDIENQAAL